METTVKIVTIPLKDLDQFLDSKLNARFAVIEKLLREGQTGSAQDSRELCSTTDLAKKLNKSRQTISKWRKTGVIKGSLIGGSWLFDYKEIIRSGKR